VSVKVEGVFMRMCAEITLFMSKQLQWRKFYLC